MNAHGGHTRRGGQDMVKAGANDTKDETPDDALIREIKEELGLDIELPGIVDLPIVGDTKRNLAIPFYVNVHSVGDHDHCCLYYLCKLKNDNTLTVEKSELKDAKWFSKEELQQKNVPPDVREIALKAFEVYNDRT